VIDQEVIKDEESPALEAFPLRRRVPWPMLLVAALFVIVAFLSWYGSWFGRPLSDSQIETYLKDQEKPRNAQHALAFIASRMTQGDKSMSRWYPAVIASSTHTTPQVRLMAAWVMGQDKSREEFHSALLPLLRDSDPGVRHNAALSLVVFGDPAGRHELTDMLESHTVRAVTTGTAELIVDDEGVKVAPGAPLVRIKQDDGQTREIHAVEEARVELLKISDGVRVEDGSELVVLAPSTEQAWEALRALYIVGGEDDIRFIERYARPFAGLPDRIQKQALATIEAIRTRDQRSAAGR
jgi:hypothetical protein